MLSTEDVEVIGVLKPFNLKFIHCDSPAPSISGHLLFIPNDSVYTQGSKLSVTPFLSPIMFIGKLLV
jgi:hypothetical protein